MTHGRGHLRSDAFPQGTALHAFFVWNEARWFPDRRYVILQRLDRLLGGVERGRELAVIASFLGRDPASVVAAEALRLQASLRAAVASSRAADHAAVFASLEALAEYIDLYSLARRRVRLRHRSAPPRPRHVLVIKLGALGDFVQALGPAAAIRRHHSADWITLLTTRRFADFAAQTGLFDAVIIDDRPKLWEFGGVRLLAARLHAGRFGRVYDLQTSGRSSAYALLFGLRRPEWSGIAWRCSHPHANRSRDPLHTIDKQAEQLLMAGIYPTPPPSVAPRAVKLPNALQSRGFAVLVPGSSAHRQEKRWPVAYFGKLAAAVGRAGFVPVVVGTAEERVLAAEIRAAWPDALDLTGRTTLSELAALAQGAALTVGNDTGVCHLAAAAGTPLIVLFSGASDPGRCSPRGRLVRILAVADLGHLPPETVIAEALEILRNANNSAALTTAAEPASSN